jgi:hypothetical protein
MAIQNDNAWNDKTFEAHIQQLRTDRSKQKANARYNDTQEEKQQKKQKLDCLSHDDTSTNLAANSWQAKPIGPPETRLQKMTKMKKQEF